MRKLPILALSVLLNAAAGAQTFEARVNTISQTASVAARRARLDMARRKKEELPPLPAKIFIGGPKDKHRKDELNFFAGGWKAAMEALKEQKSCQKFFADHGDNYDKVVATLEKTEYHFEKLQSSVGAETLDDHTVFVNSDGIFVTATSGDVTLNRKRYDLEETYRVRAMIIMHELGHQLGIFGVDFGTPDLESVNAAHSLDIIRNCLPGDGDATPRS